MGRGHVTWNSPERAHSPPGPGPSADIAVAAAAETVVVAAAAEPAESVGSPAVAGRWKLVRCRWVRSGIPADPSAAPAAAVAGAVVPVGR